MIVKHHLFSKIIKGKKTKFQTKNARLVRFHRRRQIQLNKTKQVRRLYNFQGLSRVIQKSLDKMESLTFASSLNNFNDVCTHAGNVVRILNLNDFKMAIMGPS